MQIGIIGLPQAGRRTIFRLLTGNSPREGEGVSRGEGSVRDPRLDNLSKMYPEAKKVPAVIEFLLLPPLSNNSEQNQALFKSLEEADALCYVIRVFENETVFHIDGSIEPLRDIQKIDDELILKDLSFVELRLERLEKAMKKGKNKLQEKEKELLLDFKTRLEEGHFLFDLKLNEEQEKIISGYPLLTFKKKIVVLNVNEDKLNDFDLIGKIENNGNIEVVQISAKIEQELFQLESEQEQREFLKALNIEEPAIYKMGRASYQILGL
ncbi:MAG: hypothetical protein KAS87_04160, partial [Candidatus Omnitrophica bacterium]|nr:hypothetical protein [Candidatus Omnitrophota bacterium]